MFKYFFTENPRHGYVLYCWTDTEGRTPARTHLDAVSVEGRAEKHVEKEELCDDVDEIEQLDEQVDDNEVVGAGVTVVATRQQPTTTSGRSSHVTRTQTSQVSTTSQQTIPLTTSDYTVTSRPSLFPSFPPFHRPPLHKSSVVSFPQQGPVRGNASYRRRDVTL